MNVSGARTGGSDKTAHILVIEDNPGDITLLRFALDQQGEAFELRVLRDGAEALDFIHEQRSSSREDPKPCVIVLDLHLPKHDGLTVLAAIKQTPALAHIHIAVLTSAASPKEEAEARDSGIRFYREKPSDLEEFIEVAQRILEICNEPLVADVA